MKPYRINVKLIITTAGVMSIFVFALVIFSLHKAETEKVGEILLHYGLIILPVLVLWWLLEKFCWSWRWVRTLGASLHIPPDFRGRWEGQLHRDDDDTQHNFVIEIKQTLSKIWVFTYSNRSKSQSYFSEIATDDSEEIFTLCYLWQGNGGDILHKQISKSTFLGYTLLQIDETGNPKKLSGHYFTNRDPQTKGTIELTWVSSELMNKF